MPAYNVESYIGEAIESVLSLDPPVQDLIIVDDGSTDRTGEIVERISDRRITYIKQQKAGQGVARNTGIEAASGDFIIFVDADDIIGQGLTEAFHRTLRTHSHLDAFLFSARSFTDDGEGVAPLNRYYSRAVGGLFTQGVDYLRSSLRHKNFISSPCLYIFRRALLNKSEPLRFPPILHEDELFTPALLLRCNQVFVSPERFYQRRVRSGSTMTSPSNARNTIGYLTAARWWLDRAEEQSAPHRRSFLKRANELYALAILHAARTGMMLGDVLDLVATYCPSMGRVARLDYIASRISRRLAVKLINTRPWVS